MSRPGTYRYERVRRVRSYRQRRRREMTFSIVVISLVVITFSLTLINLAR